MQTLRGVENYDISGIKLYHYPNFVRAFAMWKKASIQANHEIGLVKTEVYKPIEAACDEIIAGQHMEHFVVDMIQGGAGTSTNMNANEVIANRALDLIGKPRGSYEIISPNDHVNKCQSTNDSYPSSAKLGIALQHESLVREMKLLIASLKDKGEEFKDVIKMGRTQLQDAVPMTLGQEFSGYARTIESDLSMLSSSINRLCIVNIGGTAIGTMTAAHPRFPAIAVQRLAEISGLNVVEADNLIAASSSTGTMLYFHSILKRIAVKISQVCNDLRLMSSGPRCGLHEINLPPKAPGSSIMPGKVNPVIPEVVNQTAFQVMGNDLTVTVASGAGQLELNVMEPVIIFNIYQSIDMLEKAFRVLRVHCIDGITANKDVCLNYVKGSIGIVTALLPVIGYKKCTAAADYALKNNKNIGDVLVEKGYLKREEVEKYLDPYLLVQPNYYEGM